jgi:hypothetical protein
LVEEVDVDVDGDPPVQRMEEVDDPGIANAHEWRVTESDEVKFWTGCQAS